MTTPAEIGDAMMAVSRGLQELIDEQPALVRREAETDRAASVAAASYLVKQIAEDREAGVKRTVPEYDALVVLECHELRFQAALAFGARQSNKDAVRAAMQRLSALQSLSSTTREEMKLARIGDGP